MALFIASWEIHVGWLGEWRLRMGTLSKIFAVLFSGLIVGLSNVEAIADITALDFVIMNMTSTSFRSHLRLLLTNIW